MQPDLFPICPDCKINTDSRPHAHYCPVYRKEAMRQSEELTRRLGMVHDPSQYQLPLRLDPG